MIVVDVLAEYRQVAQSLPETAETKQASVRVPCWSSEATWGCFAPTPNTPPLVHKKAERVARSHYF